MRKLEPCHLIQVWGGESRGFVPFDVLDPQPEDIHIETIARALSKICRFNGQCNYFYSVAQHSIHVSGLCYNSDEALYGLLHDASEAYLGDVVQPLKKQSFYEGYREVEQQVQHAIFNRFGLRGSLPKAVKEADELMLATEKRDLFSPGVEEIWYPLPEPLTGRITAWLPYPAEKEFLRLFRAIS